MSLSLLFMASVGPPPSSRAAHSRGGRQHTRRLKSAWKRAASGNPKARSWLSKYGYALPPSPAEQSLAAAAQRNAGQGRPSSTGKRVMWISLLDALNHWNDCPHCYKRSTRVVTVETDQGSKPVRRCNECDQLFKAHPSTI